MKSRLTCIIFTVLASAALFAQKNEAVLVGDSLCIRVLDDIYATEYISSVLLTERNIRVLNVEIQESGWTGYSYINGLVSKSSTGKHIGTISETIGELSNLERVYLAGLGLNKLPENFTNLQRLEILDISFNAFSIESEAKKLASLRRLRSVRSYGSSGLEVESLGTMRPGLKILYSTDDFKQEYVR